MSTWQIGDARIIRLQEQEPHWPGRMITANATPENLEREGDWLKPFFDAKGNILLSIHALLIESEGHRILVDTCVGNDKKRPGFKEWNDLHLPFLAEFEKAGHSARVDRLRHLHPSPSRSRRLEYHPRKRQMGTDFPQRQISDGRPRMGSLE